MKTKQTGAALLTVRLEWKTEFHNIPKAEAVRARAWVFAFLAVNMLSNKTFIKLADSQLYWHQ